MVTFSRPRALVGRDEFRALLVTTHAILRAEDVEAACTNMSNYLRNCAAYPKSTLTSPSVDVPCHQVQPDCIERRLALTRVRYVLELRHCPRSVGVRSLTQLILMTGGVPVLLHGFSSSPQRPTLTKDA